MLKKELHLKKNRRLIFYLYRMVSFATGKLTAYSSIKTIFYSFDNLLPKMVDIWERIIPIWGPPDISGGCHLENEMYISSGEMYILTGKMYISSTSHQLKYTSFHLKYTSHSISGGRQIGIMHLNSLNIHLFL